MERPLGAMDDADDYRLAAWFLGPKAEHAEIWQELLSYTFQDYVHWRRNYFPRDPMVITRERRRKHEKWQDLLSSRLDYILSELKAHYPFYSPRYLAHMLSEQTLPSVLGYFAGLLYNPNNVTDEAAPVTVRLELEVGRMVAEMLGYDRDRSWAHLCSGGTVATLEALWVARTLQFIPLSLQEYCVKNGLNFEIKAPSNRAEDIRKVDADTLLALKPDEAIFMVRKLARFEVEAFGRPAKLVLERISEHLQRSKFNLRREGATRISELTGGRTPVILVSATAHYCLKKAADLLGYGETAVHLIPVDSRFRLDVDDLHERIRKIWKSRSYYIAAIVGVAGTTEEGAVDPLDRIAELRTRLEKELDRSAWFHVDAAWGGYVRTLLVGHERQFEDGDNLDEYIAYLAEKIGAEEYVGSLRDQSKARIAWDNPDVLKALLMVPAGDSIVVDPHKLGFVPYPAGLVAFRNGLVTDHLKRRAQYISSESEELRSVEMTASIGAVGPYIIEGSKPGFVATGCWLAHKTVPLNIHGHGKIMKTVLLNAKKLWIYLGKHRREFVEYERACGFWTNSDEGAAYDAEVCQAPFTFVPLYEPDTNVLCFVAVPMHWRDGRLERTDCSLRRLNVLTNLIHQSLDIPEGGRGNVLPHARDFFVSKTELERQQYSPASLSKVLEDLGVAESEYRRRKIVVLRSTVMNPLLFTAEQAGIDYLREFMFTLHRVARAAMQGLSGVSLQSEAEARQGAPPGA